MLLPSQMPLLNSSLPTSLLRPTCIDWYKVFGMSSWFILLNLFLRRHIESDLACWSSTLLSTWLLGPDKALVNWTEYWDLNLQNDEAKVSSVLEQLQVLHGEFINIFVTSYIFLMGGFSPWQWLWLAEWYLSLITSWFSLSILVFIASINLVMMSFRVIGHGLIIWYLEILPTTAAGIFNSGCFLRLLSVEFLFSCFRTNMD